jgi:hypothetical protein
MADEVSASDLRNQIGRFSWKARWDFRKFEARIRAQELRDSRGSTYQRRQLINSVLRRTSAAAFLLVGLLLLGRWYFACKSGESYEILALCTTYLLPLGIFLAGVNAVEVCTAWDVRRGWKKDERASAEYLAEWCDRQAHWHRDNLSGAEQRAHGVRRRRRRSQH